MGDPMMGDPGPSDLPVLPWLFGNEVSSGRVLPTSGHLGSLASPSTELYPRPLPGFPPLDPHPSASFRQDGYEEWRHRTSELASAPSGGQRDWAEEHMHGPSSHSGDPLDLMSRSRVGGVDSSVMLSDDLFTYPEGEAGAVTISRRDLECLQPGRFLSDNIIDFYIQYLKLTMSSQESGKRFHFFSSFFFRKLLESTARLGVDQCKVDYLQVRKWIGKVNLFEQDYVFIPIIDRSHWSLLVICHLKSLDPSSLGEPQGTPCILHLDPMEGGHECFEGQVRSLILQAWMERKKGLDNVDLLHALVQMKHVQAKVAQQDNGYDCGLYILHYIEVFLSRSTSLDLTLSSCEKGISFTTPNFKVEVSNKRNCIQSLIFNFGGLSQVENGSDLGLEPVLEQEVGLVHPQSHQQLGLPKHIKETKSKKWKETETLILLECMVDGGRFNKGKQGAMHWDLIVEEINVKNMGGPLRSKEQCQNRFDTLLKAYKDLHAYCLKKGKEFCNVRKDEKRRLKLATPLEEVWYNHLHTICVQRSSFQSESRKRRKSNLDGGVSVSKCVSSPLQPSLPSAPPLDAVGSPKSMNSSSLQIVVKEFNALDVALRYTFLNLIQAFSFEVKLREVDEDFSLEFICRMLAIVQDQSPVEVCKHVYQLQNLKLVALCGGEFFGIRVGNSWLDQRWLQIPNFKVYKRLGRKLLSQSPHLRTFHYLSSNGVLDRELCLLQQIRVLILCGCEELENVDLGDFPNLRCLQMKYCPKVKVVTGWEGAQGLGWVEIIHCDSYCDLPDIQSLSSLKEFDFQSVDGECIPWQLANFNQCVQLWRLEIFGVVDLVESMDLKALRFLEVLSFSGCRAFSTICGLSGLQTLAQLRVAECENFKMLPDLGCLKALTYLDMSRSGIVEIQGVEELHLLTWLDLHGCESLESLPPLGHLKALACLDVSYSSIDEIPGVEDLVSLEELYCNESKLKHLPNLDHLCGLRHVFIYDTPLFGMDPSRSFIGGGELIDNDRKKERLFVGDISDLNVFEDLSSEEN